MTTMRFDTYTPFFRKTIRKKQCKEKEKNEFEKLKNKLNVVNCAIVYLAPPLNTALIEST